MSVAFTPQQVKFIENLIDNRLRAIQTPRPELNQIKMHHSIVEIRQIIIDKKIELVHEFSTSPFTAQILAHFLSKQITLLPGDLELRDIKRSKMTTCFLHRLHDALNWPQYGFGNPIVCRFENVRGMYCLSKEVIELAKLES